MTQAEIIIEFTKAAYTHIQSLIKKGTGHSFFRLSIKKTGCSGYMYQPEIVENPKENDVLMKTAIGLTIAIDPKCLHMIKGTVVDYVKKDLGQYQFYFNNPNAIGACGCGESFHLKEE
ncbi:Fe-S cluster assembly scaffold SufA [Coxiella endosymbiont of Ornithodoros maritimus]|uniref:Fe-S cluster assembly scaffold SufA n=1 Tax=Coxiella endosymbiont of Ornithodoros maritimus TaxID=1656172 RepID=UPI002264CAAC|nr:Fe-S cluster assembly scaffold SufA [Coxiella endosymbiont of Ornithodoros maritimus]